MGVQGREPLSRARILDCAVRMADRDGLDAVTLRRIAAELGVHVTSLYNHVPTKEALVDGVVETVVLEAKLPHGEISWHDWVRRFSAAMRTAAATHPGAIGALQRRPVQGEEATASFEAALAAFVSAGLDDAEAYACLKAVILAVLGVTAEEAVRSDEVLHTDLEALSPAAFPRVHAVARIADEADPWPVLTEVLIAGLRSRIRAARSGQRQ